MSGVKWSAGSGRTIRGEWKDREALVEGLDERAIRHLRPREHLTQRVLQRIAVVFGAQEVIPGWIAVFENAELLGTTFEERAAEAEQKYMAAQRAGAVAHSGTHR